MMLRPSAMADRGQDMRAACSPGFDAAGSSGGGLSAGAIVGIVVGIVSGIAIVLASVGAAL